MKTLSIALTVSFAVAAGAFPPSVAFAGHHPHHRTAVVVGPALPRPFFARPLVGPLFVQRFVPFGVVVSPVVVYTPPSVVYAAPPVVYAPPPVASYGPPAVAPAPPSLSRVIQYPHGRYELLGDGTTTPYQWVWIPNPPPPPPPPAAPSPEPAAQQMPPASKSEIYCWIDERGVTTWTDQWDKIPVQYRARARPLGAPPWAQAPEDDLILGSPALVAGPTHEAGGGGGGGGSGRALGIQTH